MDIILASNNNGKIKEFKKILSKFNINVIPMRDINFNEEIVEDGNTFFENALIKAKTIHEFSNLPVISDDSGICVDYLNGEPGIYSARYHGLSGDDERNELLIKLLEGVENRKAHFHCSIVLYISKDKILHFDGQVYGTIHEKIEGTNGFGYDSIFIPDGYTETFGILDYEIKNKISHRAIAISKLVEYFENDFNN